MCTPDFSRRKVACSPHALASPHSRFFFDGRSRKEKAIKKKRRFMGRRPKPRDLLKKVNQNFYKGRGGYPAPRNLAKTPCPLLRGGLSLCYNKI